VRTPDNLTFRRGILQANQKQRLETGVWEYGTDTWLQEAVASDPHCSRPLFVDAGAAFGYYSLRALQQPCRSVHAFNPHPKFAGVMKLNVEDNLRQHSLVNDKVCINQVALSNQSGSVNFTFGYGSGIGRGGSDMTEVPMTTLDEFFTKSIDPSVQVIAVKMDVEAQEVNVMNGATQLLKNCRVKHWSIGIHIPRYKAIVEDIMQRNGYTVLQNTDKRQDHGNVEVLASC